jgi:archaetidylinositol phosphate synthase
MSDANVPGFPDQRPWDARLARWLVAPLRDSWVAPNHLTTVRLLVGLASAAAFIPGSYGWSNAAALLLVLSNFLDHTDGELARITGKSSRLGHLYDLGSDAVVTIAVFVAIGLGIEDPPGKILDVSTLDGAIAGGAVALIFFLRMRIEEMAGKSATRQGSLVGFETEDALYLVPLITLFHGLEAMLVTASVIAPLYAVWTVVEYRRVTRRSQSQGSREVAQ